MKLVVDFRHFDAALDAVKKRREQYPENRDEDCWAFACDDFGNPFLKVTHSNVDGTYTIETFHE